MEQFYEFVNLVEELQATRKAYAKDHNASDLRKGKDLSAKVDAMILGIRDAQAKIKAASQQLTFQEGDIRL